MSRRGFAALVAAVSAAAAPAAASAASRVVFPGGPPKFQRSLGNTGVNNFINNTVTVNAGDSVTWNLNYGFHTVDIPKLGGGDLPLITSTGKVVSGVTDAAGNDFWFNGKLPGLSLNPTLFARSGPKAYNGTTRIDSGLPLGPGSHLFTVRFLTAGRYEYFCDVHPGMHGFVVVKPKGKPIPSAAAVAAETRREENAFKAEARRVARTTVPAASVSLGLSGPGGLEDFGMFPATLAVSPGTTVRFFMSKYSEDTHTATFGPKAYLISLSNALHSPMPGPAAAYPSDPPGHIVLNPSSHGNGFANTGILDRDPATPQPAVATIKFTKPGTYHFVCLLHPFMQGTVNVK